jgi:GTP-binding protein EngB required for normal cell division/DNA-directed RNA polymerase subunit F
MANILNTNTRNLDYEFLLFVHLVCADRQIHSKEIVFLNELANIMNVNTETIEEKEKIFGQQSNLSFDEIVNKIPPSRQQKIKDTIIKIAKIDNYFAPLEQNMIANIIKIWDGYNADVSWIYREAEKFNKIQTNNQKNNLNQSSFTDNIRKQTNSVLSTVLGGVKQITPRDVKERIEKIQHKILLSGVEYDESIGKCAAIAYEDYKFAEKSLINTESTLRILESDLELAISSIQNRIKTQGKANSLQEVTDLLESTKSSLINEIVKKIADIRNALDSKQRALSHFNVAFMGKTKAGKSTLHAVITGEDWNSIGIGKQRTTRFNRVYEWKNIRIIDTPGIGAAEGDGRKDEEIAKSIVDESDVICYVVTNDSTQETELSWMRLLKENNKPLIVLLNLKHGIDRDEKALKRFLDKPDKLFFKKGEGGNGIDGHINRIQKDCTKYYGDNYFDIIPVMLLAAQLSLNPKTEQHKEKQKELFQASRIQDFLNSIRVSILEYGEIRRSQNILGSTVGKIEEPNQWITNQQKGYKDLKDKFFYKKKYFNEQVIQAGEDSQKFLQEKIEEVFNDVLREIGSFADKNWNADENTMKKKWEEKCKEIRFEDRLNNHQKEAESKFDFLAQETIEEIGKEFQLIAEINRFNFGFTKQDADMFFRNMMKGASIVLSIAGLITSFFAPPVAIALKLIGTAASWIGNLFESQEKKKEKAIRNIKASLTKQIDEQKKDFTKQSSENLRTHCNSVKNSVDDYFSVMIESLDSISNQLLKSQQSLVEESLYLNTAYAKRIVDWYLKKYESLTEENMRKTIKSVKRNFGYKIEIQTQIKFSIDKGRMNTLKNILQEDISLA